MGNSDWDHPSFDHTADLTIYPISTVSANVMKILPPHQQGKPRARATYQDYLLGSTWNLVARTLSLAVMPYNFLASAWNIVAMDWNSVAKSWNHMVRAQG